MTQQKAAIKNMDHLGLIAGMIDELKIKETIDEAIPSSSKSKNLSYGEETKAMILNGLGYVNKQLHLTPLFFKDKPLKRLFGETSPRSCVSPIIPNPSSLFNSLPKLNNKHLIQFIPFCLNQRISLPGFV